MIDREIGHSSCTRCPWTGFCRQASRRFGAPIGVGSRQLLWPALIDFIGEPLALFDGSGAVLHENKALQRLLSTEDNAEAYELRQQLRSVALVAVSCAPAQPVRGRGGLTRRELVRPWAVFKLRGNRITQETCGPMAAALVSLNRLGCKSAPLPTPRERYWLTRRESQVASLLMQRFSNAEIAHALGISEHTARHHTQSVLAKVRVSSRRELRAVLEGGEPPARHARPAS